ncbi:hypothetical protein [Streptomyces subrutilus]|uniref:Holin n=1 Tax=Streptomyces subrutilus TaxID=36818 RepID=A0A1E5NXM3_9ACTN|nr:hypothetical protein [Streptomyces subrutilus]OEJ21001.1 hypothetical protein BGK67_34460 [Streptomyces subrutilus]
MTTLDSITAGAQVGALLPLLTAVVQRPAWSAKVKKKVALVVALVAGVATVAGTGGWAQFQHGGLTLTTILAVVAASQATYDLVWKPTTLAPLIESVTSPKGAEQAE